MKIDDPDLVRREYASERALVARNRAFRDFAGVDAPQVVLDAVVEVSPASVLEVGCGMGELAERMLETLDAEVIAVDVSPRMVELTQARGVDARLADVQQLPFADGEFDVVVAAWMLYHVPDLDLGLREIHRVLRPGGRLVAATFGEDNLQEAWDLIGDDDTKAHTFTIEKATSRLAPWFERVERRDASGTIVFPDREEFRSYVSASIRRSHLADRIPEFDGPLSARSSQAVFVAEKAA
jgi:ubiquinone/menaquinone biosynthesis C-methylase UbiE